MSISRRENIGWTIYGVVILVVFLLACIAISNLADDRANVVTQSERDTPDPEVVIGSDDCYRGQTCAACDGRNRVYVYNTNEDNPEIVVIENSPSCQDNRDG